MIRNNSSPPSENKHRKRLFAPSGDAGTSASVLMATIQPKPIPKKSPFKQRLNFNNTSKNDDEEFIIKKPRITVTDLAPPSPEIAGAELTDIPKPDFSFAITPASPVEAGTSSWGSSVSPPHSPSRTPKKVCPPSPAPQKSMPRSAMKAHTDDFQFNLYSGNTFPSHEHPAGFGAAPNNLSTRSLAHILTPVRVPSPNINPFSPRRGKPKGSTQPSQPLFFFSRLNADFEVLGQIGSGSFGEVHKCLHRVDGIHYAVKIIQPKKGRVLKTALNEVFGMAVTSHPNVVRYHSSWTENKSLFIQMEYCSKGSLKQLAQAGETFSEESLFEIIRHVASGLQHIHSQSLAHLDVKPDNIYVTDNNEYKLGDFGLVNFANTYNFEEGDGRYIPRELLNANEKSEAPTLSKADIFSLGISVYELASKRPLPSQDEEYQAIRDGRIHLPFVSPLLKELVRRMLHSDPFLRPSAEELLQLLPSPSGRPVLRRSTSALNLSSSRISAVPIQTDSSLQLQQQIEAQRQQISELQEKLSQQQKYISDLESKMTVEAGCTQ